MRFHHASYRFHNLLAIFRGSRTDEVLSPSQSEIATTYVQHRTALPVELRQVRNTAAAFGR
jgi:hypothetical protein